MPGPGRSPGERLAATVAMTMPSMSPAVGVTGVPMVSVGAAGSPCCPRAAQPQTGIPGPRDARWTNMISRLTVTQKGGGGKPVSETTLKFCCPVDVIALARVVTVTAAA